MIAVCDEIDELVGLVLKDVREPFPEFGRFGIGRGGAGSFSGLLRHVEALLECARADLVLLPAASTITRAALEQSVKIQWLLHPPDVFDREARFLAHLSDEERMWERCARYLGEDALRGRSARIQGFRKAVEAALPVHISRLPRIPTLEAMMTEIGEARRYATYTILSQYSHGSHYGGSIYRQGLGTKKEFDERVSPSEWALLLQVSWWSFFYSGQTIEHVCARRDLRSIESAQIEGLGIRLSRLQGEAA
jgi:hypothetical protein